MSDLPEALTVHVVKAVACPVAPAFVRSALVAAARRAGATGQEVSVRITGDRELRRLNRSFLGHDEVTDVLSFPAGEPGYLGDIAVSWPAVLRQAAAYGHPAETELALLCVHGLLHLLGREHATAAQERAMWRETDDALRDAGVALAPGRLSPRS